MYKISAKNGFTLIIKDLNITLNSISGSVEYLSEEKFNNSKDILKIINLLNVEKIEKEIHEIQNVQKYENANNDIKNIGNNIFVHIGNEITTSSEIFVKEELISNEDIVENNNNNEEVINILNIKDDIFVCDSENSSLDLNEDKDSFTPKQNKKPGRKKKNEI